MSADIAFQIVPISSCYEIFCRVIVEIVFQLTVLQVRSDGFLSAGLEISWTVAIYFGCTFMIFIRGFVSNRRRSRDFERLSAIRSEAL